MGRRQKAGRSNGRESRLWRLNQKTRRGERQLRREKLKTQRRKPPSPCSTLAVERRGNRKIATTCFRDGSPVRDIRGRRTPIQITIQFHSRSPIRADAKRRRPAVERHGQDLSHEKQTDTSASGEEHLCKDASTTQAIFQPLQSFSRISTNAEVSRHGFDRNGISTRSLGSRRNRLSQRRTPKRTAPPAAHSCTRTCVTVAPPR